MFGELFVFEAPCGEDAAAESAFDFGMDEGSWWNAEEGARADVGHLGHALSVTPRHT